MRGVVRGEAGEVRDEEVGEGFGLRAVGGEDGAVGGGLRRVGCRGVVLLAAGEVDEF